MDSLAAPLDFTTGIPQSDAPPDMTPAFGENPWDVEQRQQEKDQLDWFRKSQTTLDQAALDPEAFFKDKDLSFARTPQEAYKIATTDAFLELHSNGAPLPPDDLSRKLYRAQLADQLFNGRGRDNDDAFHAEIVADATRRKSSKEITSALMADAVTSSIIAETDPAGDATSPKTFATWKQSAATAPGYDPTREADYYEAWTETRRAATEARQEFQKPLNDVWLSFKAGGADTAAVARNAYFEIPATDRPRFMASLKLLAGTLPEREQPGFWMNLSKSLVRESPSLTNQLGNLLARNMQQEAERAVAYSPEQQKFKDQLGGAFGAISESADFAADILRIQQQDYDPMKFLSPDSDSILSLRTLEKGIYAAPGAIVSTGIAAIPGIGMPAFYTMQREGNYQDLRQKFQAEGLDYDTARQQADSIAGIATIPQLLLERVQITALAGKLPLFDKALTSLSDKIANRALRFGARTVVGAAQEAVIETTQDLIPSAIQEMGAALDSDIPDVKWTGTGGVLDGYWTDNASMFVTMLPLAIFGAAGGISADARVKAFAEATDNEILAAGVAPADLAKIREGATKGLASGLAAIESAFSRLDPRSESAKAAVDALTQDAALQEEAMRSGVLPTLQRSASGWSVLDGETGEIVGTAPTSSEAFRLAKTHSAAMDDLDADRVAYMASMMESADAVSKLDQGGNETVTRLNLMTGMTQTMAAAEDPAQATRYAEQVALKERMAGGTGDMAYSILGRSSTEIAGNLRRTINDLYRGSTVTDVFHEAFHGFRREAHDAGRLTLADDIAVLRALDTILAGKATKMDANGRTEQLRFLPENITDDQITATMLDEAISHVGEMEILRSRQGGTRRNPVVKDSFTTQLAPSGIITRNLSAIGRIVGQKTANTFKAFMDAIRAHFGLSLSRALALKKAEREGKFDASTLDSYLAKLLGTTEQDQHNQEVAKQAADLLGTDYSGENVDVIGEGDPFSIGRTTIFPTSGTRSFDTANGKTLIGPAAFSIKAFHGTPHKVDKFSLDKIGTGEGAQAYGWGLYFAQNETVADGYARQLAPSYHYKIDGKVIYSRGKETPLVLALRIREQMFVGPPAANLLGFKKSQTTAENEIIKIQSDIFGIDKAAIRQELDKLPEWDKIPKTGNLYTVTLDVNDEDLLDWDKPLSQQPEKVRTALQEALDLYKETNPLDFKNYLSGDPSGANIIRFLPSGGTSLKTTPQQVTKDLQILGIPGIRFLDGNSRDTGSGSYNYVIFDESKIQITEENGKPVDLGTVFSLAPSERNAALMGDALARVKDPIRRAQMMSNVSKNFNELVLRTQRIELLSGSKRLRKSLQKEAAMREAQRADELERDAYARHYGILSNEDLTKIKSMPVHAYLADPNSNLRGRLMSKTAAIKAHPDLFQVHRAGDYDGADGVSRSVFGGSLMPDQAAQELFDAHLIPEPTADALWNALKQEQGTVATMKEAMAKAEADIKAARTIAREETNQWLATQTETQATAYSPKQEILSALASYDAILTALPTDIRGKLGGYTALASLGSEETRLAFLKEKLAKADTELEGWMRRQYDAEFRKLLDQARPLKKEAGEKPRGKVGADIHDLFLAVEDSMTFSAQEVEAEVERLDKLANHPDTTPEQQAHLLQQSGLIALAGNWGKADAARREAALLEATRIYSNGYAAFSRQLSAKREDRAKSRDALRADTGKAGERMERLTKEIKDSGTKIGRAKQTLLSLYSFEQVLQKTFGEDSPVGKMLADWERRAASAKHDAIHAKMDALDELFADLAQGKFKGEQLRWDLAQPGSVTVKDFKGRTQTFSQLEAISATLMWMQEDGKRHMEGHFDEETNTPNGDWHWRQQDIDAIEAQLSGTAKAVRLHLMEEYAQEYDRLNAVFQSLYGVNLPRHKFYSPITVAPVAAAAGQMMDPVTGSTMGASLTPGALRTRSQTAVAEPRFTDALQTFIAHTKQMEHWMAYTPFATEAMNLLNNREVGNSIEAAAGKEAKNILRTWIDYFAQGGVRDAGNHLGLNKWFATKLGRASQAALVGRVSVLAIQSLQLGAAAYEMPIASFVKRFAKLTTGQANWKAAYQSAYIQRRLSEMPPMVRQSLEGLSSSKPSRLKFLVRKMGETINGADALFTAGTYAIIYDYQLAQAAKAGFTGKAAEDYAHAAAERGTDRVAQPVRPGARSLYELTATSPAARLMWAFASEARQKMAITAYAIAEKPTPQKLKALAITWGVGGAMAAIIRAALRDVREDGDDDIFDEKNWDPRKLALQTLTGPFQGLPILGKEIEASINAAFGEWKTDGSLLSTGKQVVQRIPKMDDDLTNGDIEALMKDAELILTSLSPGSDSIAASASISHIVRDLYNLLKNAAN